MTMRVLSDDEIIERVERARAVAHVTFAEAARELHGRGLSVNAISKMLRLRKEAVCDATRPPALLRDLRAFLVFAAFAAKPWSEEPSPP